MGRREIIKFNKKVNCLHYYDPLYKVNICFLVAPFTKDEFQNLCHWVDATYEGDYDGFINNKKGGSCVTSDCRQNTLITIFDKRPNTVAHEAIHAVMLIFKKIGDPFVSADNDEPFAYYVDRLIEILYDFHPSMKDAVNQIAIK